jgi:hypothetical protein
MRTGRGARAAITAVAVIVLSTTATAHAEPYEDGQAAWAGSRYRNTVDQGWMTSSSGARIHDIAQIGDRVYVAGDFRGIRYGLRGGTSNRSYLIALDRDTGEPVWSFRPVFNGPVYTLAVAGDGSRLYAGGAFTRVDGLDRRRLVALAPGGAVGRGWQAQVSGGNVRAVVATRSYLYVGGSFGWVNGAGRRGLARIHRGKGRVDGAWNASASGGSVLTLEMPPSRDRIYAGGRFRSVNGWGNTDRLVALRTQDGGVISSFGHRPGRDVLDLLADGRGRLWEALDGAGGRAQLVDAAGRVLRTWDTHGDVQTVERVGDRVFFGGHELVPNDRQVATVSYASPGAWDTSTFRPGVGGGDGVWAFHADGHHLWIGAQSSTPFTGFGRYAAT